MTCIIAFQFIYRECEHETFYFTEEAYVTEFIDLS